MSIKIYFKMNKLSHPFVIIIFFAKIGWFEIIEYLSGFLLIFLLKNLKNSIFGCLTMTPSKIDLYTKQKFVYIQLCEA